MKEDIYLIQYKKVRGGGYQVIKEAELERWATEVGDEVESISKILKLGRPLQIEISIKIS